MIPALAHSLSPHVSVTAMWNWSRRTSGRGHSSHRAYRGGSHVSLCVLYFASFHGWLVVVHSGGGRSRWSAGSNLDRGSRRLKCHIYFFENLTKHALQVAKLWSGFLNFIQCLPRNQGLNIKFCCTVLMSVLFIKKNNVHISLNLSGLVTSKFKAKTGPQ